MQSTEYTHPELCFFREKRTGAAVYDHCQRKECPYIQATRHLSWHRSMLGVAHCKAQSLYEGWSNFIQHCRRYELRQAACFHVENGYSISPPRTLPLRAAWLQAFFQGNISATLWAGSATDRKVQAPSVHGSSILEGSSSSAGISTPQTVNIAAVRTVTGALKLYKPTSC